ncbi:hypothetical protein EVJ58_g8777 [Rhodofomes roseus]|uniref:Fungal-type protein kinase domain-containing protein n=1 Tax=Rhodofomes roseus TaxID=34475 RepID=A0A4Y9XZ01_9APHY|nr:hypothetical protein EVJ58_g8777 [Rhodofomes roseus]
MRPKLAELPFDEFMAEFMEGPELPSESVLKIPDMDKGKLTGRKEEDVCVELCKMAQIVFDGCPHGERLAAKNTRQHPDNTDHDDYSEQLRADISCYPVHPQATADYASATADADTFQAQTRWAWISLWVEVKTAHNDCPFEMQNPTEDNFLRGGDGAAMTLGQMAEYTAKIFRRQHRTHCFSLSVYRGRARMMRWDRAGAIVSTPIDFVANQSLIHTVFWRYASMDQKQRGFDPTVIPATPQEIEEMRTCPAPTEWVNACRRASLDQPGWPIYKILMRRQDLVDPRELTPLTNGIDPVDPEPKDPDRAANPDASFLVGMRCFAADSPTGRGTKCFIAYEVSRQRLVFLKDYWRPETVHPDRREGDVLKLLRTRNVKFVPTPIAAGDVYNSEDGLDVQKTRTQEHLNKDKTTKREHPAQVHYRLVVKEIARPLDDHHDPYQLVKVLFFAFEAHRQAWEQEHIIHRDISATNILMFVYKDEKGRTWVIGLLNDWELCKFLDDIKKGATRPGRSFMSARLLLNPDKQHELADDLESFLHVLRWMCLRFYEHRLTHSPPELRDHVLTFYEAIGVRRDDHEDTGGAQKYITMCDGYNPVPLLDSDSPLDELLRNLASVFRAHYAAVEPKKPVKPVRKERQLIEDAADSDLLLQSMLSSGSFTDDEDDVEPQTPVVAQELVNHTPIRNAFGKALRRPASLWELKKMDDQFEAFEKSPVTQRSILRSSQQSAGSKRAAESLPDAGKASSSRRARSTAAAGDLTSVAEAGSAVDASSNVD